MLVVGKTMDPVGVLESDAEMFPSHATNGLGGLGLLQTQRLLTCKPGVITMTRVGRAGDGQDGAHVRNATLSRWQPLGRQVASRSCPCCIHSI